jgi:hypothetical protein
MDSDPSYYYHYVAQLAALSDVVLKYDVHHNLIALRASEYVVLILRRWHVL